MKIGSLFSGIGGLDVGLERAGHEILWQAENDKSASKILRTHWPNTQNFGDVTEVDWSTVERPDALCAGNPCPDFSQAGQRKGIEGVHGQLWFEVTRAIRALKPSRVLLENVPGIFSSPGMAQHPGEHAIGVVLADLATLGYVGSYSCLRAADFGACHRRERFFVVAHATSERGRQESGGASQYEAEQNGSSEKANYVFGSAGQGRFRTATTADTISLVRQTAGERYGRSGESGLEGARWDEGQAINGTPGRSGPDRWKLYWPAISHWQETFGRPAPEPTDAGRLRPAFVEWMMGFDEGWTEGVAKTHRLRCLGNAVFVPIAEYLGEILNA